MDRVLPASSAFVLLGVQASDVRMVLIFVLCLVVSIAFHEFAHAFAADRLGDPTPGREGRLTLNPMAHADPIGTLALPVFAGLTHAPLFGWGRPVMTQPRFYTRKISMRAGMALVAFAGPLSNVLQAIITLAVLWLLQRTDVAHPGLIEVLVLFFGLNLTLAFFNLLPVHPLDGGKVLAWMMPTRWQHIDDTLARYGWMILLALLLIPGLLHTFFVPVAFVRDWGLRLIGG